jgi:hypothetical protein
MTLLEAHNLLDFFINKYKNTYFTPEEKDMVIDHSQMAVFADYQPKYAISQRIKDALSPFRARYDFSYQDSLNGIITIPANRNYQNLLDCHINIDISSRGITIPVAISMANEDVLVNRLNSQKDPVTITSPVGEISAVGQIQLYPQVQYRGTVTFLRRPQKPVFVYTYVSGRPFYDSINSIQLEWGEKQQREIVIKALSYLGVNLSEADLVQWGNIKSQDNYLNQNHF